MKAMILAAGLGTRLRPITDERPKALVEVAGRTLLEITLTRLRSVGVRDVIINVHHFAEMIVDYLQANGYFGVRIEISREEELLDTGGGLKRAGHFFLQDESEPFLLHNVDVISTIDLKQMLQSHRESGALATLAVQDREGARYLLFDSHLRLCGRRDRRTPGSELVRPVAQAQELGFCGIHVISPALLSLMKQDGAFSITDFYLQLAAQGEHIVGFRADEYYWRDLGTIASLQKAAHELEQWQDK